MAFNLLLLEPCDYSDTVTIALDSKDDHKLFLSTTTCLLLSDSLLIPDNEL